jgi:outer membrane protein TolC
MYGATRSIQLGLAAMALGGALLGHPARAGAQEAPVTLEALLDEALANNASLRRAEHRWKASTHRVGQSWALPDPSVGFAVMGEDLMTPLGPQEQVYEAEQMVPFPLKLWERRKVAAADADAAESAYRAAERDVVRDVSTAYFDLHATDASIRALEEILQLLRNLEQVVQSRYAGMGGSQRDVAKAQAEVSMVLERLFVLRQQRESLAARLSALLNRAGGEPIGPVAEPARPRLAQDLDELIALARASRPELSEAESMLRKERHAERLARFEYLPDMTLGFQYVGIGNGTTADPDDGRDAWMIPLKFTVPLWQNRLVGGVREARRNLRAGEAGLADAQRMAEFDVKDRYYRHTAAAKVVELYENALIPEAQLAFQSDQAAYQAGQQDALNFLDSERVYLNAKVTYYQALAESLKSYAELERAVGRSLTEAAP